MKVRFSRIRKRLMNVETLHSLSKLCCGSGFFFGPGFVFLCDLLFSEGKYESGQLLTDSQQFCGSGFFVGSSFSRFWRYIRIRQIQFWIRNSRFYYRNFQIMFERTHQHWPAKIIRRNSILWNRRCNLAGSTPDSRITGYPVQPPISARKT